MGTVTKALELLSLFSRDRTRIGLSEMSRLSGMNKATVHRMLSELAQNGFVEQVDSERTYRLGPVFLRLASLRESAVPMREVALEVLTKLSATTGETTHMSIMQGNQLCTLSYSYSAHHGTRVTMEDAELLNFHSTSSGLAVLAFSDEEFVDQVLAGPLEARTPLSETNPDVIRAQLEMARRDGVSENVSGFEEDVHSHASPVFDANQSCFGAVAVAAPVARMTQELRALIRTELPRAALEMTRLLGGFPTSEFKTKFESVPGQNPLPEAEEIR